MKLQLTIITLFVSALIADAQCDNRYKQEVFTNFKKTTETYSSNYNLSVDIYEPVGDVFAKRPLIITGFGGSFIAGSKTNPTMVEIGERFSKQGYVVAAYNYRLGNIIDLTDSLRTIKLVIQARSDLKALIRYFNQDAQTQNKFRVDTDQIWIGGNSAGAVTAIHAAYFNDTIGAPAHLKTIVNNNGGLEGNSGNDGFSSEAHGVFSLAGGINKVSFIDAGELPMVMAHGTDDGTVPYFCDNALNNNNLPILCGGGAMETKLDAELIENELLTFQGEGHTPWEGDAAKKQQVLDFVNDFIYDRITCDATTVSIQDNETLRSIQVFPNPAVDQLQLEGLDYSIPHTYQVYSIHGKVINSGRLNDGTIDVSELSTGSYVIKVLNLDKNILYSSGFLKH